MLPKSTLYLYIIHTPSSSDESLADSTLIYSCPSLVVTNSILSKYVEEDTPMLSSSNGKLLLAVFLRQSIILS